jgi:hypothetical protein
MEEELSIKYSSGTETNRKPNRFNVRKKYWQQLLLIKQHSLIC